MDNTLQQWTAEDFANWKCGAEDVGQRTKPTTPPPDTPEKVLDALPLATMAELKQAALRVARGKMGYDEFLAKNPVFHQKFLLSMAKEQLPQERPDVTVNISWLSQDRLAYKQGALMNVQSPQDVAFRATDAVLTATDAVLTATPLAKTNELRTSPEHWKPGALSPGQLLDKLERSQDQSSPSGPDIQIK